MGGDLRDSSQVEGRPDATHLIQRVADQAVAGIAGAEGASVGLQTVEGTVRYACTAGYLSRALGVEMPAGDGLYGAAMRSGQVLLCKDTTLDDRTDPVMCQRFGVRSVLCVPLMQGRKAIGVLNVCASQPGAFTDEDSALLQGLATFVGTVVGAAATLDQVTTALFEPCLSTETDLHAREGMFASSVLSPFVTQHRDRRRSIEVLLRRNEPALVFQPVFELATGRVAGYEALARFSETPPRTPDRWFAEAHNVGLGIELELAAVRAALSHLHRLPGSTVLGINVGPGVITTSMLQELLSTGDASRIVLELTEHIAVADYDLLLTSVAAIRQTGARLAIDDTGAGVSSLAHILKLKPDVIKLDRALVEGVHQDTARHALIRAMARFAADTTTHLVAEGVEDESELAALHRIGVPFAQGYHLGQPGPLA